jgi:hypothetical protein
MFGGVNSAAVKLWLQYIEDYQESTKTEFDAPE